MNPLKKLYNHFTNWRWEIGFIDNSLSEVVDGASLSVQWVNLPFRDRWFADPFILEYNDDEIIVLGEEYSDSLKKGRICKIVVDRKTYVLKSWSIVLELPTHLSFPRIMRKNDVVYIHPENNESGCHSMYRYDMDTDKLVDRRILCKERLTDAVMLEREGRDFLFSTFVPTSNGTLLHVYERKSPNDMYEEIDSIQMPSRIARMAGDFFEVDGKLYRPAQDCNGEYGAAVIIQEVNNVNGKWMFKDVRIIKSPHPVLKRGCHTFNHYKNLIVIDVKGYRYPLIGKFLETLRYPFGKKMKDFQL